MPHRSRSKVTHALSTLAAATLLFASANVQAEGTGSSAVRFQKPSQVRPAATSSGNLQFRSASTARPAASAPVAEAATSKAKSLPAPKASAPQERVVAKTFAESRPRAQVATQQTPARRPDPAYTVEQAGYIEEAPIAVRARRRGYAQPGSVVPSILDGHAEQIGFCAGCDDPACGMEIGCGVAEPECGYVEPGCGVVEPGCGLVEPGCAYDEPGCGILEPGCGYEEPSCGVGEVGCGSCVGRGGPDYWCFPVCLPRFKELSIWAGVHGFKGPRDSPDFGGDGDGNFGFQEGVNLGGRAPLVGLLFPQLGYQLSYQAVQSQLSGRSGGNADDRSQHFVTAGLFRRVPAGVQFGVAWDHMNDDFLGDIELDQLRYEISLKGASGREIGFWGASALNDASLGGTTFETVDQYAGFVRFNFQSGGMCRLWGGGTADREGLFGGDFYAPMSNRWSLQSGFNYLIPDENSGTLGAREESWNLGINFVWHYGCTAKQARYNPFMPLFGAADNGWMFVDRVQ